MRHAPRLVPLTVLALSLAALPLLAQVFDRTPGHDADGTVLAPVAEPLAVSLAPKECEDDCPAQPIVCGETLMRTLTTQDHQDNQGRYFDVYAFSGTAGQQITATMTSAVFEADLELRTPGGEDAAEDEALNPGDTARIDYTLTSTSTNWRLIAKADDPGDTGAYSLTLQCSGTTPPPPPPPPGFFIDPAYPNFRFRVRIGDPGATIPGRREGGCQPETVCVSGALPGRSEIFVRILGPRPNGFLWPTIVRFTPSRVVVDIQQVSTMQMKTYTLAAVPPGVEDLSGRQDRMGFLP